MEATAVLEGALIFGGELVDLSPITKAFVKTGGGEILTVVLDLSATKEGTTN